MKPLSVIWLPPCTTHVRNINPWLAARICKAVYVAAETGRGKISRIHPAHPDFIRIRVEGAAAEAEVDRSNSTLYVLRIYPTP